MSRCRLAASRWLVLIVTLSIFAPATSADDRGWNALFTADLGQDSNPLIVGDDPLVPGFEADQDAYIGGRAAVNYWSAHDGDVADDERFPLEFAVRAGTSFLRQDDVDEADLADLELGAIAAWDGHRENGLAFVFRYDFLYLRAGDDPFDTTHRVAPSVMYTWPKKQDPPQKPCHRVSLRGAYEFVDDRAASDPALDRTGKYRSIDAGYSLRGTECPNIGVFTEDYAPAYWKLFAILTLGREPTEGAEYDRDTRTLSVGGRFPLGDQRKNAIDVRAGVGDADHDNPSTFDMAGRVRRDDTLFADVGLDLGLPWRGGVWKSTRLRVGYEYTRRESNVSVFDYRRWVAAARLTFVLGDETLTTGVDVPAPGSDIDSGSSSSGPNRPEITTSG